MEPLRFAIFGSSLVSSYWNGAATYYRGIARVLHEHGHHVAFYEPDAWGRQEHRDIDDPDYARVVVYEPESAAAVRAQVRAAAEVDVIVKTSGVGVFDDVLEEAVAEVDGALRVFWDVDAPATLARMEQDADDPSRALIAEYDLILTYGGGAPVIRRYEALGARRCVPIYNALDPSMHHPVAAQERFAADLTFLGNRLPDREARVREYFFATAERLPDQRFLLGGSGWDDLAPRHNLRSLGHVSTADHNALNASALAVLNVSREGMASNGHSPATRVFEVAGAAGCLITDAWPGIKEFLEPGREVLVAHDGAEVALLLENLEPEHARAIGAAARARVLADHTYEHRVERLETALLDRLPGRAL